ncbi:MAG: SigE family RNA polymerase sigma factor [Mycobacteriaceae bacterium]
MEVAERVERSFADVVSAHAPALLRLAVMLTGDPLEAEDLLQSTLLRSVRHSGRVAAMSAPAAYMRRVMVNEHLSSGRRHGRLRLASGSPVGARDEPTVPAGSEAVDARDEVWRWLTVLKPRQRAVLVLRFYEDLTDAAIADALGCREATVRSHAFRGLAVLRSHLSDLPAEEHR